MWCIAGAIFLLSGGMAFAYFVAFPLAIHFSLLMSARMGFKQTFGVTQYFSFMFNIILPISVVLELPLVGNLGTTLRCIRYRPNSVYEMAATAPGGTTQMDI